MYLSQNQDFVTGNTHFTKIVRTANTIISQITQPGKFSGVSTIIIDISESYKKKYSWITPAYLFRIKIASCSCLFWIVEKTNREN